MRIPSHWLFTAALIPALAATAADTAKAAEVHVADVVRDGNGGRLTLIVLNDGNEPLVLPAEIDAVLTDENDSEVPAVLTRDSAAMDIPAGGFAKPVYRLSASSGILGGEFSLVMSGALAGAGRFALADPASPEDQTEMAAALPADSPASPPDSRAEPDALEEASADNDLNLSLYRPMYALIGTSPLNAKLQFSFKYALVDPDSETAENLSFLRGIYFGYTQTMFWDLGLESSPFRSIDFQPELFYRYRSDLYLDALEGSDINVQAGLKHYSNGREEPASRSFNTAYIEPSISVPLGEDYRLTAAPRAWVYFGDLEDNPDIDSFRGNSGLRLTLARKDGAIVEATALGFIGTGRGSLQTDVSYPLQGGVLGDLNLALHGQLFTGYGDNLLDYNRKSTRLRFGLSLRR